MKLLSRIIPIALFIIFFGLAVSNPQAVSLQFFFGYKAEGPLVLVLLAFFAAGALLGLIFMMPILLRTRRELKERKELITALEKKADSQEHPELTTQPLMAEADEKATQPF